MTRLLYLFYEKIINKTREIKIYKKLYKRKTKLKSHAFNKNIINSQKNKILLSRKSRYNYDLFIKTTLI